MKKTKENILNAAQQLFNAHGVADVSLRKIAAALGISHTNLIYHFKTKNEILDQLHLRILNAAKAENEQRQQVDDPILGLLQATESGFAILQEYRFFMLDLNYIMRMNEPLRQVFLEVEQLRAGMYQQLIQTMTEANLMREEEYPGEYPQLIKRIRIFSDYWISSSAIYDSGSPESIHQKQVGLLMSMFYPYLTEEGKALYREHVGVLFP